MQEFADQAQSLVVRGNTYSVPRAVWLRARYAATVDEYDRTMAINGRGTFLCYKYAAEQMIQQGKGGRIIGSSCFFCLWLVVY
jgi:NAD(P)-dependent dehydrogenase (short-subunit alcohol dehydrogenase family)